MRDCVGARPCLAPTAVNWALDPILQCGNRERWGSWSGMPACPGEHLSACLHCAAHRPGPAPAVWAGVSYREAHVGMCAPQRRREGHAFASGAAIGIARRGFLAGVRPLRVTHSRGEARREDPPAPSAASPLLSRPVVPGGARGSAFLFQSLPKLSVMNSSHAYRSGVHQRLRPMQRK